MHSRGKTISKTSLTVMVSMTTGFSTHALAQGAANYPAKAIRWIVGYAPSGTADMMARAKADG